MCWRDRPRSNSGELGGHAVCCCARTVLCAWSIIPFAPCCADGGEAGGAAPASMTPFRPVGLPKKGGAADAGQQRWLPAREQHGRLTMHARSNLRPALS